MTVTMGAKGHEVALGGDGQAGGPVGESQCLEDSSAGEAVELHGTLQPVACVQHRVGVARAELGQAGGQQRVLTLQDRGGSGQRYFYELSRLQEQGEMVSAPISPTISNCLIA